MINYLTFNLLPYREEARAKKKKDFGKLLIACGILGVVLAALGYGALQGAISHQESRNQKLQQGIQVLDKQIAEVQNLEREREKFLARKKKIEELQNQRYSAAQMFYDLTKIIPDGVYLTAVKPTGTDRYSLIGNAVNDNMIANFMTSIPATGLFELPELRGITTIKTDFKGSDVSSQQFTIDTKVYNEAEKLNQQGSSLK